jgi:organic hydroperoxide reductase OsmC/OhrA
MSTTTKAYDFPLSLHWIGGRRTVASATGKHQLEVATPPVFTHGIEGVWSPEDLFVGSVASCFALTLVAVAERRGVPLWGLDIAASGNVAQRDDGRFGFTEVTLDVDVVTDDGFEREAEKAAHDAESGCIVASSLDVPVKLDLKVNAHLLLENAR